MNDQIPPLDIAEPATWENIDSIISKREIVIDSNGHK